MPAKMWYDMAGDVSVHSAEKYYKYAPAIIYDEVGGLHAYVVYNKSPKVLTV